MKTAIVGLGRMGAEPSSRVEGAIPNGWIPLSHIEAIQQTKGLELVAICDSNHERLEKIRDHYRIDAGFSDYQRMIDEVRPEILSVATRTDVRSDILNYALSRDVKGFYVEKPVSRSLGEWKHLLSKMEAKEAKLAYGATRRAMEVYEKARDICWSGELGEIKHIVIEFGRAALLWTHPHSVDLITFFSKCSELKAIQGFCTFDSSSVRGLCVDDDPVVESGYFQFANGISGAISSVGGMNVRVGCSRGNLTVHGNGYSIEINRCKEMPGYFHSIEVTEAPVAVSGARRLYEDLRDALSQSRSVSRIGLAEITCGQTMLFGLVESALQKGKIISPAEIRADLVVTGRSGNLYA